MCEDIKKKFSELYSLDVNKYVEKKDGLSYLTWSYAWAEFKKIYPDADYSVRKDENGRCYFGDENIGYMVYTSVTAGGLTYAYGDDVYRLPDETADRISAWYKGRAYIYDNNYIPDRDDEYESLLVTIENVIKQYGVKMICVDNLMTAMETVTDQSNLYLAQSNFVGSLKKIAVRYDVVVILVAHPRKNGGDFTNDDVSGSGDITNKVDVVMSYQRDDADNTFNGKLTVTKNRLSGKCAMGVNAIGLIYSEMTKRIFSLTSGKRHYGWEMNEIFSDNKDGDLLF